MSTIRQTCPACKATFYATVRKDGETACASCGRLFKAEVLPESLLYYARGKQTFGPVSLAELQRLATAGQLGSDDLVLQVGAAKWQTAHEVIGLSFASPAPAASAAGVRTSAMGAGTTPHTPAATGDAMRPGPRFHAWLSKVVVIWGFVTTFLRSRTRSTKIMLGTLGASAFVAVCIFGGMCCVPGFPESLSKSNSRDSVKGGPAIDPGPAGKVGDSNSPTGAPKKGTTVTDLDQAMAKAGFGEANHWMNVMLYAQYGSPELANRVQRDQFARIQAEKDVAFHRDAVQSKVFCLRARPIAIPDRSDFATNGLFVTCREIPLRLRLQNKQKGDAWSGNIRKVNLSWADLYAAPWFLTKSSKLAECLTPIEVDLALRNKVLYHPDGGYTDLLLNLAVPLDLATRVAHQPNDFVMDIVFDNTKISPTIGFGYYHRDALDNNDWNAAELFSWNLAGGANPGNAAIVPFFRPANQVAPTHVHANLVSLTFRERGGTRIASYIRESPYGEFQMPTSEPVLTPPAVQPRPEIADLKVKPKFPIVRPKYKSRLKKDKNGP